MTCTDEQFEVFSKLQPRWKQTLALTAAGYTQEEIAKALKIKHTSVHNYIVRAKIAMHLRCSTLALAVFIVRHPKIERMLREAL